MKLIYFFKPQYQGYWLNILREYLYNWKLEASIGQQESENIPGAPLYPENPSYFI